MDLAKPVLVRTRPHLQLFRPSCARRLHALDDADAGRPAGRGGGPKTELAQAFSSFTLQTQATLTPVRQALGVKLTCRNKSAFNPPQRLRVSPLEKHQVFSFKRSWLHLSQTEQKGSGSRQSLVSMTHLCNEVFSNGLTF